MDMSYTSRTPLMRYRLRDEMLKCNVQIYTNLQFGELRSRKVQNTGIHLLHMVGKALKGFVSIIRKYTKKTI